MVFRGPPGTGKTTIAMLVSKILFKLGVVENEKCEIVLNPLIWKGLHCGETVPKVNKSVEAARGGVLFVDEAYLLLQANDKFGEEIMGTLMSHMLPPKCVFIFAGYSEPMEAFMTANAGLKSRCPFIFNFESSSDDDLVKIFRVMCDKEHELCDTDDDRIKDLILKCPSETRDQYNGRMVQRILEYAQKLRNIRLCNECSTSDQLEALGDELRTLSTVDIELAMDKFLDHSKTVGGDHSNEKTNFLSNFYATSEA